MRGTQQISLGVLVDRPGKWTLFCSIIDNLGDIGVSWRLAHQLANEYDLPVDLWVDDWPTLQQFLSPLIQRESAADTSSSFRTAPVSVVTLHGVTLRHWSKLSPQEADLDDTQVIIEMFGCQLPDTVLRSIAGRHSPPCWINLEYLSAEPWVRELHGLPSPQTFLVDNNRVTLAKTFFLPGFETGTGGLIRERGLLAQHQRWQQQLDQHRIELLQVTVKDTELIRQADSSALWLSLFCYHNAALPSLLKALTDSLQPTLLWVPDGRVAALTAAALGLSGEPAAGHVIRTGQLTLVVRPFVSQHDYDQLLSLCDLNFVRGEDSFVRAQWAAKPFLWHIYPQEDGVHMDKLQAFMNLYGAGAGSQTAQKNWQMLSLAWNKGDDVGNLWHDLRPHIPALLEHARNWQQSQAQLPDLGANLLRCAGFAI